jgi:adenosylhomocysteine nucleosidase
VPPNPDLQCDLLLFVAVDSELEQLAIAAKMLGVAFQHREDEEVGEYYRLGVLGSNRVLVVKTRMGAHDYRGSATQGHLFRAATTATGIIQLGMGFGIDPTKQRAGEVMVSTALLPYDSRDMVYRDGKVVADYTRTRRRLAKPALVNLFRRAEQNLHLPYKVWFGTILSGGARIHTRHFRDELVAAIPAGRDPIIGGEMEAVGLLSLSDPNQPLWIVVKAISDFADEDRDAIIESRRPVACRRAACFVLRALLAS